MCIIIVVIWLHVGLLSVCISFFHGTTAPSVPVPPQYRGFTITHIRHTTLGRTPLDEWPARRRDLYLTTHNTHNRQTSMPPARFEPAIPVSKRPQTHALDRTATRIRPRLYIIVSNYSAVVGVCAVTCLTARNMDNFKFFDKNFYHRHRENWVSLKACSGHIRPLPRRLLSVGNSCINEV
jgi:hypothetical protein